MSFELGTVSRCIYITMCLADHGCCAREVPDSKHRQVWKYDKNKSVYTQK
jgi:hypothetical protein